MLPTPVEIKEKLLKALDDKNDVRNNEWKMIYLI